MDFPPRTRALSTRVRLILLVTAVLVPVVAFAGVLLARYAAGERARAGAEALEVSQRVSAAVDRELTGLTAALEALATSPSLQPGGDLAAFDAQARAVLRSRGSFVAMRDRTGQQVINSSRPFGSPLPVSTDPVLLAADREVFETGRPVVSGLVTGTTTRLQLVLIDAPVRRNGAVAFALNIALDPARLAEILASAAPPEWTVALVDRRDRIIARSRQHERFLGSEATVSLRESTRGEGGTWLGVNLEGAEVVSAYTRSALSGWRVAVGVPATVIEAPVRRLTGLLAGASLLVMALSAGFAVWFARSIGEPMRRLAAAAAELGRGRIVAPLSTGLREANEVGQALTAASLAIVERRAALEASEERFKAAVRAVEGVVWTNDAEGRMTGEQPGWAALTGQTRQEYEGTGWASAVHPDDAAPTVAAWTEAVRERRTFVFEHRVRRYDGTWRRFSIRAVPVLAEDGRIRDWVGVHTDVTDLRRAEEGLRESEARFRHMADSAPALIWMTDEEGRIIFANMHYDHLFGRPAAEMQGEGWREIVHPEDLPTFEAVFAEAFSRRGPFRAEVRVRDREGAVRWLRCEGVPRLDDAHRFLGYTGCNVDITDAKVAEEHHRLLINELNHRVKNTLATVQSVASQTLRNAGTLEEARSAFEERLIGLSRAHDVLTRENWEGAALDEIVGQAVVPYAPEGTAPEQAERLALSGPATRLSPRQALALAMALQELATNAVKYGAWSNETGRVEIAWTVQNQEGAPVLRLRWQESGGPAVSAPQRRGFGSRLIERSLAQDLGGTARIAFETDGVSCAVEAPLTEAPAGPWPGNPAIR